MICKICQAESIKIRDDIVLQHRVSYFHCPRCGFLQTEEPYWLREAYAESITTSDTGILRRNLHLAEMTTLVIFFFFQRSGKFLDHAGGYGIFTRLMRDIGFDFYWQDKYSANLVARGFEYDESSSGIELVTSFESFEHFANPLEEFEKILRISRNILLTTELIPDEPPPRDWWYYGLEHGQHVSFYSLKTLRYIADAHGLSLNSDGRSMHLFTEKRIPAWRFRFVFLARKLRLSLLVKRLLDSKTVSDMQRIVERMGG